jgi:hypothetical protein
MLDVVSLDVSSESSRRPSQPSSCRNHGSRVPTDEYAAHQFQLVVSKESSIAIHIGYRT